MNRIARSALIVLFVLSAGARVDAQEPNIRRLEVTVTAVSGKSIYIDIGREALVEPGDQLRLFPPGGSPVRAEILSVSRTSSRAVIRGSTAGIDVGTRGEVWIAEARVAEDSEQAASKPQASATPPPVEPPEVQAPEQPAVEPKADEHPPWEHPPESWDSEMPLLAPAYTLAPEERDVRIHGRAFTGFDYTDDGKFDSTYQSWRSGMDLEIENGFGRGGVLFLEADFYTRSANVDDGEDDTDTDFRLDRASYRWGGLRGQPDSWEVGRFFHMEFPELGALDGVEFVHRMDSGSRLGASLGFLPEPTDEFKTAKDFGAAVFHRYVSDESEAFTFGTAYQKTMHEGSLDRDLLINTLEYHPSRSTTVHATSWVDFYTSSDDRKNSSVELTQLLFDAQHRSDAGHGVGIFASRLRWPDMKRHEFQSLTDEQIEDNKVSRIGTNGWLKLSKRTRLSSRVDYWEDQDDSGESGRLRLGVRDFFYDRGEVSFEAYGSKGKFSDTVGGRVNANRRFDNGFLNLYWDTTEFHQVDFDGDQEDLLDHRAGLSYDTSVLGKWDVSVFVENRFGDEQDSWSVGFFLQRRF